MSRTSADQPSLNSSDDPFMTLVDAAASLLDTEAAGALEPKNQLITSPPLANRSRTGNGLAGGKKLSFAEELMCILDDELNHDVLDWMPDGLAFTVVNHRKFTVERMPKLFKINNMSSFVRKLTRWGFQRVHDADTKNSDVFRHPYFQRGKPELLRKVKCVGVTPPSPQSSQEAPQVFGIGHNKTKKVKPIAVKVRMVPTESPTKESIRVPIPVTPSTPKSPFYHSDSWAAELPTTSDIFASTRGDAMYQQAQPEPWRPHAMMRQSTVNQRLMLVAEDSRLSPSLRSRLMAVALKERMDSRTYYPGDIPYPIHGTTSLRGDVYESRSHFMTPTVPHYPCMHPNDLPNNFVTPRFYNLHGGPSGCVPR